MNIAIDVSPVSAQSTSQHKVRGVGFYIERLREALITYYPSVNFDFISNLADMGSDTHVLHIPFFDPFILHLPLQKKVLTAVTVHDLTPLLFPMHFPSGIRGSMIWQLQKRLLQRLDAIITDSNASKKDIAAIVGYPLEKIHVVYLAADTIFQEILSDKEKVEKTREKYRLPKEFILYVGDATWNKNLPNLAKAVQKTDIPLVTVGKAIMEKNYDQQNPWNRDLYTFQKLADKSSNIQNLGFIETEELVSLYNIATALVMPSHYEGFGLPILEAMQCGCPVITTKNGSLPEVAGDGGYYTTTEVGNLSNAIKEVWTNKKLQVDLKKKGLIQARKFSWQITANDTMKVYKKIYDKKNSRDR